MEIVQDRKDDPAIKEIKQKKRKKLLDIIRASGDHVHNVEVLREKKGELILVRRPVTMLNIEDYGPCPNCKEWLRLTIIKRHQATCPANDVSCRMSSGCLLVQSNMISGRLCTEASKALTDEVFIIIKQDDIGKAACTDPLIVALGNDWMIKNVGNRFMRKYYTSNIMRLSARLKLSLTQLCTLETGTDLGCYLQPKYFEEITTAISWVAKQSTDDEEDLASPSNAIKLTYHLKKLTSIKLAQAIISKDDDARKDAKVLLKLMGLKFSTKLARVLLGERSIGRQKPLPLPEDIKKLSEFLSAEMQSLDLQNHSFRNFVRAAQLAQTKLITYSRRRCGELQAML